MQAEGKRRRLSFLTIVGIEIIEVLDKYKSDQHFCQLVCRMPEYFYFPQIDIFKEWVFRLDYCCLSQN